MQRRICRLALGDTANSLQTYRDALILNPPVKDVRSTSEQFKVFCSIEYQKEISEEVLDKLLYPYLD